jgi:hypothetical protein
VADFYANHPGAPRRINAVDFASCHALGHRMLGGGVMSGEHPRRSPDSPTTPTDTPENSSANARQQTFRDPHEPFPGKTPIDSHVPDNHDSLLDGAQRRTVSPANTPWRDIPRRIHFS